MKTRHYAKKLTATTTQQSLSLDLLVEFSVLNAGSDNVYLEIDNDISSDSLMIPAGMSANFKATYIKLNYKADSTTATLYVYGVRHKKE